MEILALLIGVLIAAGIAWYVSRPLAQHRRTALPNGVDAASLEVQRELLYAQIRELDLDHATGKTNDEDHRRTRAELVAQAADMLRQIDASASSTMTAPKPASATDADLEAAIASRRKVRARSTAHADRDQSAEIEAAIAARRDTRAKTASTADLDQAIEASIRARRVSAACPNCGKPVNADDVFCSKCGASLQPQTAR